MDDVVRGLVNMICFLLMVDYILWVLNGPYWSAM